MNEAYINTTASGLDIHLIWDVNKHEAIRERFELIRPRAGSIEVNHKLWSSYALGTPVTGTIGNTVVNGAGFCLIEFNIYEEVNKSN